MKKLLEDALHGRRLSVEEARNAMLEMLREPVNEPQIAAFLVALRMRGVTVDELDGFSRALQELAVRVDLSEFDVVDVCGTGGDHKGTFNISTSVAFVLAGAGCKVAKHGNYAVSSACGSSNVLEHLGIRFTNDNDALRRSVERAGVCFLHAPLFHPALKQVAHLRRQLGIRTVFNVLGPLVNPAHPSFQMSGVYDLELVRLYSYLLSRRGTKFGVVHSLDGYDELSLTGSARVAWNLGSRDLSPREFGLKEVSHEELLAGETVAESAAIVVAVLSGRGTVAQEAVVVANAALAMWCRDGGSSIEKYVEIARESIRTGAAKRALELCKQEQG
jgi:anthranilate phosphoribosyltransferase